MLRKPLLTLLCALLLAAAFCYGVARLFILRYEKGDVYPAYSSLRADPLGVKGIYDALDQLPGVDVQRNFRALPKLKPATPITLVYPGIAREAMWEQRELAAFDSTVLSGSRAIFTFLPFDRPPAAEEEKRAEEIERKKKEEKRSSEAKKKSREKKLGAKNKEADEKQKDGDRKKPPDGESDDEEPSQFTSFAAVAERWGVSFDYLPPAPEGKIYDRRAIVADPQSGMERTISWHTAFCFKDLKPGWKTLYTCDGKPALIERRYGSGSIVLAADSFFLSNEAMRSERHPKLLSWLFDGPPMVVFDEEHHGVREDPGIATLARKYRLHGVVAGLVLIAILFVWKNSVRFIPAYEDSDGDGDFVAGKESSQGFVNLLHRTIRPADILDVCIAEWRKAFPHHDRERAIVGEFVVQEHARPARQRNPVATYASIANAIARR
jgi:hypothetical protein